MAAPTRPCRLVTYPRRQGGGDPPTAARGVGVRRLSGPDPSPAGLPPQMHAGLCGPFPRLGDTRPTACAPRAWRRHHPDRPRINAVASRLPGTGRSSTTAGPALAGRDAGTTRPTLPRRTAQSVGGGDTLPARHGEPSQTWHRQIRRGTVAGTAPPGRGWSEQSRPIPLRAQDIRTGC